ncbi:MAG: hypothetical protein K0S07_1112 [Chlamydiales bacterium]|nr:hypothetical protein [Chlamydiales bacterium]
MKFMKRNHIIRLLSLFTVLAFSLSASEQEEERAPSRPITAEEKVTLKEKMAQSEQEKAEETTDIQSKGILFHPMQHLGEYHFLRSVAYNGETVELEDGSLWKVRWSDQYSPLTWFSTDRLTVHKAAWHSSYDYEIYNQTNGSKIEVNLKASPILYGAKSYWVTSIDIYTHQVILNDGSIWYIYPDDFSTLLSWRNADHVIIGINDGVYSGGSYPNLLINGCDTTSIRAACVN